MNDRHSEGFVLADVVGKVGLHDHLCMICETQEEQLSAAVPFIKIGLERGEKCIYIADATTAAALMDVMREKGINVDFAVRQGRLTITNGDIYPYHDGFDPDRMIEWWEEAASTAESAGFSALRVAGEMTCVTGLDPRPERPTEYEAKLNQFVLDHDALAICQYDRRLFPPEVILNILRTHPVVIYGGCVCENPYDVTPEEFLSPRNPEREIQRMLARMLEETANRERLRQSEERIRQASERYQEETRALIDAIPQQIWSGPADGSVDFGNERLRAYTGLSLEELQGNGWKCTLHPDDRERVVKAWEQSLATGTPYQLEVRHRRADGKYRWFLSRGVPVRDEQGRIARWYGTKTDIEDRKLMEEALRENEADLAEAQRVAKLGSWKFNVADDSVTWSEEVYRIFDVDKGAFGGVYKSFLSKVHPEDRARVLQTNRAARESGGPFEIDYRIVTRAGAVKNVREVGYVKKDANGNVLRLFGTVQDITDYRRAQEELQKLSGRLLRLQDEERQRIARDLHDATGQNLVALATMLGQLRQFLPARARKLRKLLSECQGLAAKCISEIRTLSYLLHPPALDQAGLTGAIRDYVKGFSKRSAIQVELELSVRVGRMAREAELALFRVVQEALTNIQRHSGSRRAKIRMNRDSSNLRLEIMDSRNRASGRPARRTRKPYFQFGVGIRSMQERVNSIGGRFEIDSTSHGTIVRVTLPVGDEREKTAHSIS